MEQIYKRVTFQLGDVLNSDMFYPNSYFKSKGIQPLEEDETEEDRLRKQKLIEEQEEERLRKLKQEQDELELQEQKRKKEQKDVEDYEKMQKESADKAKLQKGILKKSKVTLKKKGQFDEYGNPIQNNHPLHKLKVFNTWEKQYKIGPGLTNFGNTCFINSILQVITYTPPLSNYFTQKKHSAVCQINSSKKKPLSNISMLSQSPTNSTIQFSSTFCLMCFLENHMKKCFAPTVNIIHPVVIVNNMHKLITDFKIGKQEDPLTFFMIIVSSIKKEPYNIHSDEGNSNNNNLENDKEIIQPYNNNNINSQNGKGENQQDDFEKVQETEESKQRKDEEKQYQDLLNQKNAELFNNMFTGAIQYNISCTHCKMEQIQYELFYTLVLEIKGMDSLDDCLSQKFAEKEVFCKQCKASNRAVRTSNIYNFPNIMVIKINRFYEIMKIQKNIDFKTELNLQEYSISKQYSPQHNYVLYAMLTHQGSVAWGGHYYSYIKDSSERWYCMNDSSVRQVSINEVKQDPPYLLFYMKQEPSHQLAIPEDLVTQKNQIKELSRSLSQKRNLNLSSKKKIDVPPENFYNVAESPVITARNGSNLYTKRSNNANPAQKVGPGIQIGQLREPSKSPQSKRLKSSLGLVAPSPARSRISSINEDAQTQQAPIKNYQIKKTVGRTFKTPQKNRELSQDFKKIQNEERSYYLIPISDEKQRFQPHSLVDGDGVKFVRRKSKQNQSLGAATTTNRQITNEEYAFQQNFEFERSRVVKMPKIRKTNADQSDYLKLSEISMMPPSKLNEAYLTNKDKKRIILEQRSKQASPQRSVNAEKQFNFYEDYEKRFSGSGFAQQVYNISYISGSSTKNSDCIPFISPKKPTLTFNHIQRQTNDSPFNFGFTQDEIKPYHTFNLKKHKQSSQEDNYSDYQMNLSAMSCTEPYRSNNKTPSDLSNTFELSNQLQNPNRTKIKTQSTINTQGVLTHRQNSFLNGNKTNKRKRRKRASSYEHIRTLLENCDQRNQSLPDKLFYKNLTSTSPTKKKKKQPKSARQQKPEWQF